MNISVDWDNDELRLRRFGLGFYGEPIARINVCGTLAYGKWMASIRGWKTEFFPNRHSAVIWVESECGVRQDVYTDYE